ncbi:MAG: DUF58 domain-containing protein [Planctomycetota bacterium]|nr:MAG: DUF58 domain-containing protein [Planctomycetota bacterium]
MHRSPYHGFSVEFAEHREYVPGDDIKHIDWKVYARSDRYYIKQYEEETNLTATILIDGSESMAYRGSTELPSKKDYACYVAASLVYLILRQRDAVGLTTFDESVRTFVPPGSSPSHRNLCLSALNELECRERTGLGPVLHSMAERVRRKGLIILISDLLDDPEAILAGLRHFRHRRHEVIVFHVLDHAERTFPFRSMTRFEGLERLGHVICDASALRAAYLEELEQHVGELRHGCRADRIDYVPIDTATPLDVALTSYLATRAGMKLS